MFKGFLPERNFEQSNYKVPKEEKKIVLHLGKPTMRYRIKMEVRKINQTMQRWKMGRGVRESKVGEEICHLCREVEINLNKQQRDDKYCGTRDAGWFIVVCAFTGNSYFSYMQWIQKRICTLIQYGFYSASIERLLAAPLPCQFLLQLDDCWKCMKGELASPLSSHAWLAPFSDVGSWLPLEILSRQILPRLIQCMRWRNFHVPSFCCLFGFT